MPRSKTYDIMIGTETANNKPNTNSASVPLPNNVKWSSSSVFDPLGDVNKKLFNAKTDDYKDTQYKEEHKKTNAETKLLQETLNKNGYTDSNNKPLVVDGIYGPNTEYAYKNAVKNNWKNLNNTQFNIELDEISSAVNKAYTSLTEKADNRKLDMSPDEVEKVQQFLNDHGYTDLQGKKLAVDGILGDRTKYAFEKYIQEDTPKAEVLELQKKLNEYKITDSSRKPLVVDGKLGLKTDSAVYNAATKYGKKKNNKTLDTVSNVLTGLSLVPGLDSITNAVSIPVDLLRGDFASAGLSAVGVIPYVGEIADTAKLAKMADKAVDAAKVVDKVSDTVKVADKAIDTAEVAANNVSRSSKGKKILDSVSNSKLNNTIKEMYRPGAKVGDGGLADAIRHEIKTGNFVGGKSHIQKGTERLRNLERIFEKETLTKQEREIVENLIEDLKRALGGE